MVCCVVCLLGACVKGLLRVCCMLCVGGLLDVCCVLEVC